MKCFKSKLWRVILLINDSIIDNIFIATCLIALGVIRIIFLQVSGAADIVLVGYYL